LASDFIDELWSGFSIGNDANELQRCLGHQFQRYINSYPKPRLDIAAGCSEGL